MFPKKLCCFNLKNGLFSFGIFQVVISGSAGGISFVESIVDKDIHMAYISAGIFTNFLINAALICGTYKESRIFLLPYLITECLLLCIVTIVCIIFMFQKPILILVLSFLVFLWYIWLCVLSFYQMLDPHNQNYVVRTIPASDTIYVGQHTEPPPVYFENKVADV